MTKNAPPVSAPVTFQVNVPPPQNQSLLALALLPDRGCQCLHDGSPMRSWDSCPITTLGYREDHVNGVRGVRPDPAEGAHPRRADRGDPRPDRGRERPPRRSSEAAEAASVSRTTAYRYFPNQTALLIAAHPEIDDRQPAAGRSRGRPRGPRSTRRSRGSSPWCIETEAQQRTMLRLSLEADASTDLPLRKGRAIGWFAGRAGPAGATSSARPGSAGSPSPSAVRSASSRWSGSPTSPGCPGPKAARQMRWSARAMLAHALTAAPTGEAPALEDRAGRVRRRRRGAARRARPPGRHTACVCATARAGERDRLGDERVELLGGESEPGVGGEPVEDVVVGLALCACRGRCRPRPP